MHGARVHEGVPTTFRRYRQFIEARSPLARYNFCMENRV